MYSPAWNTVKERRQFQELIDYTISVIEDENDDEESEISYDTIDDLPLEEIIHSPDPMTIQIMLQDDMMLDDMIDSSSLDCLSDDSNSTVGLLFISPCIQSEKQKNDLAK